MSERLVEEVEREVDNGVDTQCVDAQGDGCVDGIVLEEVECGLDFDGVDGEAEGGSLGLAEVGPVGEWALCEGGDAGEVLAELRK